MATLLSLVALIAGVFIASSASQENAVSFYGGYHQETVPAEKQDSLTVRFTFRSLQDSGVLLIATLSGTGYLAVVVTNGSQLQVLLRQQGETATLSSTNFTSFSSWQSFELTLGNQTLEAKLQDVPFTTHTFAAPVQVQSVYFGGAESFLRPLYAGIPFPRYFVGCLANMTVNTRPIIPDLEAGGLEAGCCVAPRYPVWCLDTAQSNLTLAFPPVNTATDVLTLSFRLRPTAADGLVMVSLSPTSSTWSMQLLQGQLQLSVNISGRVHSVHCPGLLAESANWHQVDVFLSSGSISCTVDGISETTTSIFPSLISQSFFPRLLQLGGASDLPGHVSGRGFVGCLQRPRVNDVDIAISSLVSGGEAVRPGDLHWSQLSVNTSGLVVTEGMTERLSSGISLLLPLDEFADDLASLYQLELENAIHFEIFHEPHFGHLHVGHSAVRVQGFDYRNILTSDPAQQVVYSHDNPDNDTDAVVFRVWAGCAELVFTEQLVSLVINVEERDASLRLRTLGTLHLAVGTQRVVSPEVVSVEDPEASDPDLVLFSVHSISVLDSACNACPVDECEHCEEEEPAGSIVKNGISIKFFDQDEINRGVIAFQHFEKFSTAPLLIRLGVTGSAGDMLDVMIPVSPHQGHFNLTTNPNSCLFVKEEGAALFERKHLNTVTDFEDQDPVVTYDLLALPRYGTLQRYEAAASEWVDLFNYTNVTVSPFGETPPTSFTQADVDNGHVRYVQSKPFSISSDNEDFQFNLRSYNFSGPKSHLCVHIIHFDFIFQPYISVDSADLVVAEGASAAINHSVFNTSLDRVEHLVLGPDLELDVHQLGIEYTLLDPPSFGRLQLQGEILVAGDIFAHRDVTASALVYFHDGSENHEDHFSFYAEASSVVYLPIRPPNRTSNLTLVIDVTPVNDHFPELALEVESIRPPEGCWVSVTTANINVTDVDRPPEPLRIFLRKRGTTPTGIFAFRSNPGHAILQFYMRDILDNNVIFVHHLNPNLSAPLDYSQTLRIFDGLNTIRKPILIAAVPLVLEVSLTLPPNACFGTIDADQQDLLQVRFDSVQFSATLCDHFGNNADLVPNITVTITSFPEYGRVFAESGGLGNTSVSQFQFGDLSRLVYVLEARNATGDELGLHFSRGHSVPVRHTLRICIQPALAPLSMIVAPLELMQGGVAHLTTKHLAVTTSREQDKDALVFYVDRGPRHGSLLDARSDESIRQFTHGDLTPSVGDFARSAVVYEYSTEAIAYTEDDVLLTVCSSVACLPQQVLPVVVFATVLTVQNSSIRVREGDLYQFQLSDFNISAPPDYDIRIVINEKPLHGRLFIKTPFSEALATYFNLEDIGDGRLHYENTVLERLHDRVEVSVEAEHADETQQLEFILRIVIIPVNNHPPEVVAHTLTVVQGGSALISTDLLSAHDFDAGSSDNALQWSIPDYLPVYGYLFLDTDPGDRFLAVHNWLEGDIKNNRLYYRNTHPKLFDVLLLLVSDGDKNTTGHLFVEIVLVNFKQHSNSSSQSFRLQEGAQKRITYQFLRYYAANDDSLSDSDFLIIIQTLPSHGQLTLDEQPLFPGSSFPQQQLSTSQVVYSHDHSNTVSDRFTFDISVPSRQDASKLERFDIAIDAVDDDPPVAIIPPQLFVVELQRVSVNVRIEDHDSLTNSQRDDVVCQLVQPLRYGRLEKLRHGLHIEHTENFTKFDLENGKVWYQQLGLPGMHPDQMVFNVTDGINRQSTIYNLTVFILPQVIPVHLGRLSVSENKFAVITNEEIMVNHPYLSNVGGEIALEEGSGPRHGTLINTRALSTQINSRITSITSFTTEDIHNGSISYFHNGDESLLDSFRFVYRAREPSDYNRMSDVETFYIDITPVNDERPIIHVTDNSTSLKLWATETVVLSDKYFNITDYDTPPSKLNITFQLQRIGGYLALSNDTATSIHWFVQADIRAHRVVFVHEDGPLGAIVYNVTDGVHTETSSISLYADTLSLECLTQSWQAIQVGFLDSVTVTRANLHCTTSDGLNDREISYHIPGSRLGHFEVGAETTAHFNSTEIDAGLVMFVHTETGLWLEEGENLSVSVSSHPASPESDLPLFLRVHYPSPPPGSRLAVNRELGVAEGASVVVDVSALDGRNLRYLSWMTLPSRGDVPLEHLVVRYQVMEPPRHGNLTLAGSPVASFTQEDLAGADLQYSHDGSETLSDMALLGVTVRLPNGTGVSDQHLERLHVRVRPVNDQAPTLLTLQLERVLVKHFVVSLTTLNLEVTDGDNLPDEVLLSLLTVPNNTQLLLNGSALASNSTLTQRDINQRWISLNPFSVGVGSFKFTFSDGELTNGRAAEFVLTVEDHELLFVGKEDMELLQNETSGIVLSSKNLNTSTNGYRSETLFTVLIGPSGGRITVEGAEPQTFTQEDITFTQEDIDESKVLYVPSRETHEDSFSFNVSNRNCSFSVTMSVHIAVLGHIRESSVVQFGPDSNQLVLPPDILLLEELKEVTTSIPFIELLEQPKYGHLEMQPLFSATSVGRRATDEIARFRYDELQLGWIVYVWDYPEPVHNLTVTDSFAVLVTAGSLLPGRAVISLIISPPSDLPPASSSPAPSPSTMGTGPGQVPSAASEGGFPVYTLVPIIGTILFLLLLIVIVVAFCLSQQKKIKKKWVPSVPQSHPQSPWSTSCPPIPSQVAHYDFDPSGMPAGESEHHNSDTSSGFSEPDSPRHTPVRTTHPLCSLPPYHHHPPHPRMRSNVSITFSSRHSESDMSTEADTFIHSSLSHYPPQSAPALPLPTRPASHAAFNRPLPALDSGMVSLNSCSLPQGVNEELGTEEREPPGQCDGDDDDDAFSEWAAGGKALPDFSDPNVQRLFHAHNPVLKKEEYWV